MEMQTSVSSVFLSVQFHLCCMSQQFMLCHYYDVSCMNYSFFHPTFMDYWDSFLFGAIINTLAVDILEYIFCCKYAHISVGYVCTWELRAESYSVHMFGFRQYCQFSRGSGSWKRISWVMLAQSLSCGQSQNVSRNHSHLKA